MNEKEDFNSQEQGSRPETHETAPTNLRETNAHIETKKRPRKISPLWQWLILLALVVGLGAFVTATPMLNQHLPWVSNNSSYNSNSSNSEYTGFCDLGGARAGTCGPTSDSSRAAKTAFISYASFTLAMPILIAILTFLTLLNTLMFMSMTISLNNIKTAIADIYNDRADKS